MYICQCSLFAFILTGDLIQNNRFSLFPSHFCHHLPLCISRATQSLLKCVNTLVARAHARVSLSQKKKKLVSFLRRRRSMT